MLRHKLGSMRFWLVTVALLLCVPFVESWVPKGNSANTKAQETMKNVVDGKEVWDGDVKQMEKEFRWRKNSDNQDIDKVKQQPNAYKRRGEGPLVTQSIPVLDNEVDYIVKQLRDGGESMPRRARGARSQETYEGATDGFAIQQRSESDSTDPFPREWICQFELDGHFYNLSPLFEASKVFNESFVMENIKGGQFDSKSTTYNYYIGFCQDIQNIPDECKVAEIDNAVDNSHLKGAGDVFEETSSEGSSLKNINVGAVYQIDTGENPNCHKLGSVSEQWSYDFLDHRRPINGIRLSYYTGDKCRKRTTNYDKTTGTKVEWVEEHRRVNLNIRCNKGMGSLKLSEPYDDETARNLFKISKRASVSEKEVCVYNINIPSVYGCPIDRYGHEESESFVTYAIGVFETIVWIVTFAVVCFCGVQLFRHRRRVSLLMPLLLSGDNSAWEAFQSLLLSVSVKGDKELQKKKMGGIGNGGMGRNANSPMSSPPRSYTGFGSNHKGVSLNNRMRLND